MGRPPLLSCESMVIPKVPPNKKKKGQGDPGKGSAAQHKGSLAMYTPSLRTEGRARRKGKRPGPLLAAARTAAPFFFVAAALPFPLCASYLHPAGWQAQHGLCSGSGSGSGISTRAKGLCPGHGAGDARFVSTL